MTRQQIIISVAVAFLLLAWAFRFQTVTGGNTAAYLVNRWTGTVYRLIPHGIQQLKAEE